MRAPPGIRARVGMAALGVLLTAAPSLAQDIAGTWRVDWAQAVRVNRDGSMEIQRWGTATLVLEARGDSVFGTWRPDVADVTWQVRGTLRDGRLRLVSTEHDSQDPELGMVESLHWRAGVAGDEVEGEMWMVIPRVGRAPARRPWRAVREGGG